MYKEESDNKIREMLRDSNIYQVSQKDPTNSSQTLANNLVSSLVTTGSVDPKLAKKMKIHNAIPPRIYGLRKTHMEGFALRPVVSCTNSRLQYC